MIIRTRSLVAFLALACGAVTVGCKSGTQVPTGFGVNVIVDSKALSSDDLMRVVDGLLDVTGAETVARTFGVQSAIQSGELRFRYIPNVQTGVLNLSFEALDSSDAVVGVGQSTPVTLGPGAVAVTIRLVKGDGKKRTGALCSAAADCTTGFCVDGVCCDETCTASCESCALPDSVGLCAGYAANTDPEFECGGSTAPDGGASGGDAGANRTDGNVSGAPVINAPEAGVITMPNTCAGTCNGMRACAAFPLPGIGCGDAFCNTHRDIASFACDGKGGCQLNLSSCIDYGCNQTTAQCRTQCSTHTECLQADYCNGNGQCVHKKADGLNCATDAECNNGHCATGICCNSACDVPATCNVTGSVGKCACPGVTCAAGIACEVYYQDADVDGFGNRSGTLAAGTAKAACAGAPPAGFVADNTDCDDNDANAHPGQTAYFALSSKGTGTFDYDCSGTVDKESPEYPGASCKFCGSVGMCDQTATTCTRAGQQAYLACTQGTVLCGLVGAAIKTCAACGRGLQVSDDVGFTTTVACGANALYTTCNPCAAAKGVETPTTLPRLQRCR